ncbi:MAG TPA: serine hydrolase domain-containing protein, partial [bacterium]|nr:serine hydrolase domain-containing protein [bacterium]
VFGVASVTKSFTAAAIMRLADDRRLSADDPVLEYLPELRVPRGDAAAVRIHHFLTHTSGFPPLPSRWYAFGASARLDADGAPPPVPVESRPPFATAGDLMTYLTETDWTPLGPPGAYFSYSNEGFALLGEIVARVSGRPYERFVTDEILGPLGLTRTAFGPKPGAPVDGMTTPYIARGHDGAREIVAARTWWHSGVWDPAGGICSTVLDLLRYLDLYRGGSGRGVLSAQAIDAMLRPHAPTGPRQAYGYGFGIIPDYWGAALVEHGGGRRSISAHVACVPSRGTAVAILANLAEAPVRAIAHGLLNVLEGRPPGIAAIAYPDSAAPSGRLESYVGEYRSGEGSLLLARIADGRLEIEADGERLPARAVGPDAFTVTVRGTEQYVRFHRNGGDRAWAVAYGSRVIRRTG